MSQRNCRVGWSECFGVEKLGPSVGFGCRGCVGECSSSDTDIFISPAHHCGSLEFIFTVTLLILITGLYVYSVQVRKCDTRVRAVCLVDLLLPPSVHVEPVHSTT